MASARPPSHDRWRQEGRRHLAASDLVRAPLSLHKLVYLDGEKAVIYRSRMTPLLGRNFEAMDPLEWLARLSDHIPDPGQHRTLFYGEYSNRTRGSTEPAAPDEAVADAQKPRKRCSPRWARLIAKVYQVDPLGLHSLRPAHERHCLCLGHTRQFGIVCPRLAGRNAVASAEQACRRGRRVPRLEAAQFDAFGKLDTARASGCTRRSNCLSVSATRRTVIAAAAATTPRFRAASLRSW